MMGFIIAIHIIVCALLIFVILIQAGRGGGLVEGFSGAESMFGTKTSLFLTRATSIFSIIFFITCIMLALLSARQNRSLMYGIKTKGTPPAAAPLQGAAQPSATEPLKQEVPQKAP